MKKEEKMVEIKEMIDKETGEIKESIVIHRPEEVDHIIVCSKEEQKLHEAFMQAEKYRMFGKRKDPFVQTMPPYEKGIVGTYSAKQLECLMKLLPYMNYNGHDERNQFDIIKIKRQPAILTSIGLLWELNRVTTSKYMEAFIQDGIIEKVEIADIKGQTYRFTSFFFLKGKKEGHEFTKKIILNKLTEMVDACEEKAKKALAKEKRRKHPRFTQLYPLALLSGLMTKTHYKTFFLLHNHEDNRLVQDGEKVTEALRMAKRFRQFKFLKQIEMWNMYRGQSLQKLSAEKKAELEACLQVLLDIKALGRFETGGKKLLLINPSLVYVSPNIKFDENWKEVIEALFSLKFETEDDGKEE